MTVFENAIKIILKLKKHGFVAYFAGGWVRDFIMKHPSTEIDIATSAPPDEILNLFKRTIPVGVQFGTVIVVLGGHQFEVTTFRVDIDYKDGRRPSKIELSSVKEDASRRDFTINGMFYDPIDKKVLDFVDGKKDLEKGIIRAIGDPILRFEEDRLRMIRAVRFSAVFNFPLESKTREAIIEKASKLFPSVAVERVWQEFAKMKESGCLGCALIEMQKVGLLQQIFPKLKNDIKNLVSHFEYFPKKAPLILYLMELFPKNSLTEKLEVCRFLKLSNKDIKLVEGINKFEKLMQKKDVKDVEWTRTFANPNTDLFLEVIGTKHQEKKALFLRPYKQIQKRLKTHIDRIIKQKPLVTSNNLIKLGIKPGIEMGELLRKAETIAINSDLNSASEVIKKLSL